MNKYQKYIEELNKMDVYQLIDKYKEVESKKDITPREYNRVVRLINFYLSKEELDFLMKNDLKDDNPRIKTLSNGIPLYINGHDVISDDECNNYIDEIYSKLNEGQFLKVNINSSEEEIKYFLIAVTNFITIKKINYEKYNYHHLGYIHSYFINKGFTNVYKSMELFLRNYYPGFDITEWYLDRNIENNNFDSIIYKLNFLKEHYGTLLKLNSENKNKIDEEKIELANKLYNSNNKENLIALANYYYDDKFDLTNSDVDKCINKIIEISDLVYANKVKKEYQKVKDEEEKEDELYKRW